MRRRRKPFDSADLERQHHAPNPAHIGQGLEQIRLRIYLHDGIELLFHLLDLDLHKVEHHQLEFNTLPREFRQFFQAHPQAPPTVHPKYILPSKLDVVTSRDTGRRLLRSDRNAFWFPETETGRVAL